MEFKYILISLLVTFYTISTVNGQTVETRFECVNYETSTWTDYDNDVPGSGDGWFGECNTQVYVTLENDDKYPDFPDGYPFLEDGITIYRVNDGADFRIFLDWVEGWTGTVRLTVYYQKTKPKFLGLNGCKNDGDRGVVAYYDVTRETINPQGTILSDNIISSTDGSASFNLGYEPSNSYTGNISSVKYYMTYNDGSKSYIGSVDSNIENFNFNKSVSGFGDYLIETEVEDKCGTLIEGPIKTILVRPSCYQDDNPFLEVSGTNVSTYEEGFQVEKNTIYNIVPQNITDFESNYVLESDGGDGLNLFKDGDTWKFEVTDQLGSYTLTPSIDADRANYCAIPPPIKIFTGGRDLTIAQPCPLVLPGALEAEFGYNPDDDPESLVLQHFAATIRSETQVVVKPGMVLESGAELVLEYTEVSTENDIDSRLHFVETTFYNDYGETVAENREYIDSNGRLMQSQTKNITKGVVLASSNKFDEFGRKTIVTLPAPVKALNKPLDTAGCGLPEYPSNYLSYQYNGKFFTGIENDSIVYIPELENGIDTFSLGNQENSLGWYYSDKNGSSENDRINEQNIAISNSPYSRNIYASDGEIKGVTMPGDVYKAGGSHVAQQAKLIINDDDEYLTKYLDLRETYYGLSQPLNLRGSFYARQYTDVEGRKSIIYFDKTNKALIKLLFDESNEILLKSYLIFDNVGRLLSEISPNGISQYEAGVPFNEIDKITYQYNARNDIISIDSQNEGLSEFVYRKDGQLRFSQNAKQRQTDKYSYSIYDNLARLIESGEYDPNDTGIQFGSTEMMSIIENNDNDGGFGSGEGQKSNWTKIFYDLKDPNLIHEDRNQSFVRGRVSYVKSLSQPYTNISEPEVQTSWYSYDERGRLIWEVKDIAGLGLKSNDYTYDARGNVRSIGYQRGSETEAFFHYYEYDQDSRLAKVYISKEPPEYNSQLEIINLEQFELQANYDYYLDGSLKRTELGNKLQGLDYYYTVQGFLKGINHSDKLEDPGSDGIDNEFRPDLFGMNLSYFQDDYVGASDWFKPLSNDVYQEKFNGNIGALTWHNYNVGKEENSYSYQYEYDSRNQIINATFGQMTDLASNYGSIIDQSNAQTVNIDGYDLNGNLSGLSRKGDAGELNNDFNYVYKQNSNQLDSIIVESGNNINYFYNEIGQLEKMTEDTISLNYTYNRMQLMTGVFMDEAHTLPIITVAYDESGNRLSKVNYDSNGDALWQTWYIWGISNNLMAVYAQNLQVPNSDPILVELPVYGNQRIGNYQLAEEKTFYELKDHLGNIRVIIGETDSFNYLATMEDERAAEEIQYFSGINSTTVGSHLNHTPDSIVVGANRAIRINNVLDGEMRQPIGGGITLRVFRGDTVRSKVQAKYEASSSTETNAITVLAGYLASAFGMPIGGEGTTNIFDVTDQSSFAGFAAWDDLDESQPRLYLNYLFFDDHFNLVDFGFDQVSDLAKVPSDTTLMNGHAFEELSVELAAKQAGYVYMYFSNEDERSVTAYFDDFEVDHIMGDITYASDYYPYGLNMDGREMTRKSTRYDYQGEWSEKDSETGLNSFNLRQYDARIGRFTTTDPYGQYPSPYMGMGNNPTNGVDVDGGAWSWVGAAIGFGIGAGTGAAYALSNNKKGWGWYALGGGIIGGTAGGFIGGALHSTNSHTYSANSNIWDRFTAKFGEGTLHGSRYIADAASAGNLKYPSNLFFLSKSFEIFRFTNDKTELVTKNYSNSYSFGKNVETVSFQFRSNASIFDFDLYRNSKEIFKYEMGNSNFMRQNTPNYRNRGNFNLRTEVMFGPKQLNQGINETNEKFIYSQGEKTGFMQINARVRLNPTQKIIWEASGWR